MVIDLTFFQCFRGSRRAIVPVHHSAGGSQNVTAVTLVTGLSGAADSAPGKGSRPLARDTNKTFPSYHRSPLRAGHSSAEGQMIGGVLS
jgi:hypothetical protein